MTATRGPLPARIYWVRRSLVLLVALGLVFAIARVLGSFGGDDATGSTAGSATSVAQTGRSEPDHVDGLTLTPSAGATGHAPLSQPTGACDGADVAVAPAVAKLPGGGGRPLTMQVSTTSGETCTWHVSARTLAVRITRDGDRIWSSQDCPGVVPDTTVVVRPPEEPQTDVDVAWGGHGSVPNCVGGQPYVGLGYYQIEAASIGGEPAATLLRIVAPPRPRVTESPSLSTSPSTKPSTEPRTKPSKKPSGTSTAGPGEGASDKPTKTPSKQPGRQ